MHTLNGNFGFLDISNSFVCKRRKIKLKLCLNYQTPTSIAWPLDFKIVSKFILLIVIIHQATLNAQWGQYFQLAYFTLFNCPRTLSKLLIRVAQWSECQMAIIH
jgi:hypothetical protein